MSLASLSAFILFILLILSEMKKQCVEDAWLPRFLRRHYPHQVQGFSSITPVSQPSGSPAFSFSVRIRLARAQSLICRFVERLPGAVHGVSRNALQARSTADEYYPKAVA